MHHCCAHANMCKGFSLKCRFSERAMTPFCHACVPWIIVIMIIIFFKKSFIANCTDGLMLFFYTQINPHDIMALMSWAFLILHMPHMWSLLSLKFNLRSQRGQRGGRSLVDGLYATSMACQRGQKTELSFVSMNPSREFIPMKKTKGALVSALQVLNDLIYC